MKRVGPSHIFARNSRAPDTHDFLPEADIAENFTVSSVSPSFPLSAFKLQPRAKSTFSAFAFHPSTQLVYPVVSVLTSTRLSESPRGRQTHPARRAVHLSSRHSLTSSSYSSRSQSRSQSCLPRSVRSGRPSGCAVVASLVRVATGHTTHGRNVCLRRTSPPSARVRRRPRRRFRLRLSPIVFTLPSEDFHTSPAGRSRSNHACD